MKSSITKTRLSVISVYDTRYILHVCVCKFKYMYLLSHQQASLCMCLNYS